MSLKPSATYSLAHRLLTTTRRVTLLTTKNVASPSLQRVISNPNSSPFFISRFSTRGYTSAAASRVTHWPEGVHPLGSEPKGLILANEFLSKEEHDNIQYELSTFMSAAVPTYELVANNKKAELELAKMKKNRKMKNLYGDAELKALPATFAAIQRVVEAGFYPRGVNALQINEYEPHQGCPDHVDAPSIGDTICMFSLGTPCVMDLKKAVDESKLRVEPEDPGPGEVQLLLNPASLLVLQHEARSQWLHGVRPIPVHTFGDRKIERDHRFSVVFWRTLDADTPREKGALKEKPSIRSVKSGVFTASRPKFNLGG